MKQNSNFRHLETMAVLLESSDVSSTSSSTDGRSSSSSLCSKQQTGPIVMKTSHHRIVTDRENLSSTFSNSMSHPEAYTSGIDMDENDCSSSSLTCFLSQLLAERNDKSSQHLDCNDLAEQDHHHQASVNSETISLVEDNARAHGCSNLRLVRTDSFLLLDQQQQQLLQQHQQQLAEKHVTHTTDCTSPSCGYYEEKKEDTDAEAKQHIFSSDKPKEARQEESSRSINNIRILQRPCRWSSDDSLNNSMLPNSPLTKTDYIPKYPQRRSSNYNIIILLDDDDENHGDNHQSVAPRTSVLEDIIGVDTLEKKVNDVLEMLQLEDNSSL